MNTEEKKKILKEKKNSIKEKAVERVHSGDHILDCIFSNGKDHPKGYPYGKVIWLWGPSKAGKSALALEAIYAALKQFGKDNVEYLWLDVEEAYSFDSETRMGFSINDGKHITYPKTVEELQAIIELFASENDPKKLKIMVLDSLDALSVSEELDRKEQRTKEFKKNGSISNIKTYGMEKAKKMGEVLRTTTSTIAKNNIILFVISQERDNVNAGLFEKKTKVSGGKAPGYYSSVQMELKEVESFGDKYRQWGACIQIHAQKTRTPFEGRRSFINTDWEQGFDPISSNIDFLYDLKDEYGKLDPKKINTLKWEEKFNLATLDGDAVSNDEIKQFIKDNDYEDAVKEKYNRLTTKNMQEFINDNEVVLGKFVEKFGVMSRDALITWIESDDTFKREDELIRRAQEKFYYIEEKSKPVRRKRKAL